MNWHGFDQLVVFATLISILSVVFIYLEDKVDRIQDLTVRNFNLVFFEKR